ncbi:MAG: hypothetical protein AABX05_06220 [Nanoarchaeota archaeon]
MGLEGLLFDVEGVKVAITPELHLYHDTGRHEPFIGLVPVKVQYQTNDNHDTRSYHTTTVVEGHLSYDTGKKIFITSLSDFVPTDPNNTELLEKYAKGMAEAASVYTALDRCCIRNNNELIVGSLIAKKHFFKNSAGEWKEITYWLREYSDAYLRSMASEVK